MPNIRADDQQHHRNRAHQQAQQGTNGAHDLLLQGNRYKSLLLVFGIRGLKLTRQGRHLRV